MSADVLALTAAQAAERIREPAWLGTPSVQKRSLTATGTPASGASSPAAAGVSSATHRKALSSSLAARSR